MLPLSSYWDGTGKQLDIAAQVDVNQTKGQPIQESATFKDFSPERFRRDCGIGVMPAGPLPKVP